MKQLLLEFKDRKYHIQTRLQQLLPNQTATSTKTVSEHMTASAKYRSQDTKFVMDTVFTSQVNS